MSWPVPPGSRPTPTTPDIAAFTALADTPTAPPPADVDEMLARVLWARFTPAQPRGTN